MKAAPPINKMEVLEDGVTLKIWFDGQCLLGFIFANIF